MLETGSLEEHNSRMTTLVNNHDEWLKKVAYNLSKNNDVTNDLVQELYCYLLENRNKKLYYLDSFNLKYCYAFLRSRYMNLYNREKRSVYGFKFKEFEDTPYDRQWDDALERFESDVKQELDRLEKTKKWASAKIYKMYIFSDKSMEKLSEDIGISKSTTFMSVKKIKQHLQNTIDKPQKKKKDGQ